MNSPRPERFQLIERIHGGAMGTVYRAHDAARGHEVALKVLSAVTSAEARARFAEEARLLTSVRSPHVVEVYDFDAECMPPWIALELVPGEDLERTPPEDALEAYLAVAGGLTALHEAGVVHRDVKPANVVATSEGRLVLVDLGLAQDEESEALTRTGHVVGTPTYMAPEVLGGERATPASDFYSWGVSLFQGLEGRLPFDAPSLPGVEGPPLTFVRTPSDAPVASLIRRCLDSDPQGRPSSLAEVRAVLVEPPPPQHERTMASEDRRLPPAPVPEPPATPRPRGGSRAPFWVAPFVALTTLTAALTSFSSSPPPEEAAPPVTRAAVPPATPQVSDWVVSTPPETLRARGLRAREAEAGVGRWLTWLRAGGDPQGLAPEVLRELEEARRRAHEQGRLEPLPVAWTLGPAPENQTRYAAYRATVWEAFEVQKELLRTLEEEPESLPGGEAVRPSVRILTSRTALRQRLIQSWEALVEVDPHHRYLAPFRDATSTALHRGVRALQIADRQTRLERVRELAYIIHAYRWAFFGAEASASIEYLLAWTPRTPEEQYVALAFDKELEEVASHAGFERARQGRGLARAWAAYGAGEENPMEFRQLAFVEAVTRARVTGATTLLREVLRTQAATFRPLLDEKERAWLEEQEAYLQRQE